VIQGWMASVLCEALEDIASRGVIIGSIYTIDFVFAPPQTGLVPGHGWLVQFNRWLVYWHLSRL
jgi:hypothetical protein